MNSTGDTYVCTPETTILGTADLLLSSGRNHDSLSREECEKECDDKEECASFVSSTTASRQYCELWSSTAPVSTSTRHSVCAKREHEHCTCLLGSSKHVDSDGCQKCQPVPGSESIDFPKVCQNPQTGAQASADRCDGAAAFQRISSAATTAGCSWSEYIQDMDWAYDSRSGSDKAKCAAACLARGEACTGFELETSGGLYCALWFNGACSSTMSRGYATGTAWGTAIETFVVRPACAAGAASCKGVDITALAATGARSMRAFASQNVEFMSVRFTVEAARDDAFCKPCQPGFYQDSTQGTTECKRCDEGRFQSMPGQSSCQQCPPTEKPKPDGTGCQACPVGSVKAPGGKAECRKCRPGTYAESTGAKCAPCSVEENQVQPNWGQTQCLSCDSAFGGDVWTYAEQSDKPCREACAPGCTAAMQNQTTCATACNSYSCGFSGGHCSMMLIDDVLKVSAVAVRTTGMRRLLLVSGIVPRDEARGCARSTTVAEDDRAACGCLWLGARRRGHGRTKSRRRAVRCGWARPESRRVGTRWRLLERG